MWIARRGRFWAEKTNYRGSVSYHQAANSTGALPCESDSDARRAASGRAMWDPELTESAPVSSLVELGVLVAPVVLVALQRVIPAERLAAEPACMRLLQVRALIVPLLVVRPPKRLVALVAVVALLRRRGRGRGGYIRDDGDRGGEGWRWSCVGGVSVICLRRLGRGRDEVCRVGQRRVLRAMARRGVARLAVVEGRSASRVGGRPVTAVSINRRRRRRRRTGRDEGKIVQGRALKRNVSGTVAEDELKEEIEDIPSEGTANPLGTSCRLTSREEYP